MTPKTLTSFSALSFLALFGCEADSESPITMNNIVNIENSAGCCGCEDEDPCETDDPCSDDDTGEPGDTGIVDEFCDFEDSVGAELDLEVSKVDVAFLLDTTCSMSAEAAAMADEFSALVDDLESTVSDAAYGFATFDDYNYCSMGAGADRPFILQQQVTTDEYDVQSALDGVVIHSGIDSPESSMEGLYQGLTGIGYDQINDSIFDATTDVMPFMASAADPFGGTAGGSMDSATVGGGTYGGYGFRDGSLPVIVYATDNYLRDPDAGYAVPPDANFTAGESDVIDATSDMGARLIGVATQSSIPVTQMDQLAVATGSLYAGDSDGLVDDPLVFTWTGSSAAFRETIVDAIEAMLDNVTFAEVTAEVDGNVWGFTTNVSPSSYTNVTVGADPVSLGFSVSVSGTFPASDVDQTYPMTLNIYGDGTTLLGTQDITVVVPACL